MTLKILLRKQAIDRIHSNPTLRQNYISMCSIALTFRAILAIIDYFVYDDTEDDDGGDSDCGQKLMFSLILWRLMMRVVICRFSF